MDVKALDKNVDEKISDLDKKVDGKISALNVKISALDDKVSKLDRKLDVDFRLAKASALPVFTYLAMSNTGFREYFPRLFQIDQKDLLKRLAEF